MSRLANPRVLARLAALATAVVACSEPVSLPTDPAGPARLRPFAVDTTFAPMPIERCLPRHAAPDLAAFDTALLRACGWLDAPAPIELPVDPPTPPASCACEPD